MIWQIALYNFGQDFRLFGSKIDQLFDLELLEEIHCSESLSKPSNQVSFTFLWIDMSLVDVFYWENRPKQPEMTSEILNVEYPIYVIVHFKASVKNLWTHLGWLLLI